MANQETLLSAAQSFDFDVNSLAFISNSCNEVYKFSMDNQDYILRLSKKPLEYVEKVKAEVEWVYYLVQNGLRASLPIRTLDHELTAVYKEDDKWIIATAFQMAEGRFFDKDDPHLWGPAIFKKWGETMGRMHHLSKSYHVSEMSAKRDEWKKSRINNPYLQQGKYDLLLDKLISLEHNINSLPREKDAYGLIHNDFHPYNFYIKDNDMTVFDFDDSIYGWYSLDIAIAATHAVWWGSTQDDRESKNQFAQTFLQEFLQGYTEHNQLDVYWIQQIPMFMEYRNICSFFWWLSDWDGDESKFNEFQHSAIMNATRLIEQGQSFDGCDVRL